MFATQAVPVDACFAVTCDNCGKTTWKVSSFVSIVLFISTFGARTDEQIVVPGDTARFVAGKRWTGALRSLFVAVPSMDVMLIVVF